MSPAADGAGPDEDARWQEIVAHFGERAVLDDTAPGADEDAPTTRSEPPRRAGDPTPSGTDGPVGPDGRDGPGGRDGSPLDPWVERHLAEEHFVPPEPTATPLPEPRRLLAWLGVLGVPVLLVVVVALGVPVPSWGGLLLLVWFLGGFGYLVSTMRHDDEDDGDNGAVV